VKLEVHFFAAKGDTFHLKTKALVGSGFERQLDLATDAHNALPGKAAGRRGAEETGDRARVPRISGSGGDLTVGGYFPFWDGKDHAPKRSVTSRAFVASFESGGHCDLKSEKE